MNKIFSLSDSKGNLELIIFAENEEPAIEVAKMKILDIIKDAIDCGDIKHLDCISFNAFSQVVEKVVEISVLINENEVLYYLKSHGEGNTFDFDTLGVYK